MRLPLSILGFSLALSLRTVAAQTTTESARSCPVPTQEVEDFEDLRRKGVVCMARVDPDDFPSTLTEAMEGCCGGNVTATSDSEWRDAFLDQPEVPCALVCLTAWPWPEGDRGRYEEIQRWNLCLDGYGIDHSDSFSGVQCVSHPDAMPPPNYDPEEEEEEEDNETDGDGDGESQGENEGETNEQQSDGEDGEGSGNGNDGDENSATGNQTSSHLRRLVAVFFAVTVAGMIFRGRG